MSLQLVLTSAGFAALINAQNIGASALVVAEIGLTADTFIAAATLEALPGEFKRITTFGGDDVADDVIHVTMLDDSDETYELAGFAVYLDDGTLFAAYSQAEGAGPILEKAAVSQALLSVDISLSEAIADLITFGDTDFLNPPATTERQGVIEIATEAETLAGLDEDRAVTPKGLKGVINALVNGAGAALDTLFELGAALGNDANFAANVLAAIGLKADKARTVAAAGLATGGGDLSADRTITVPKAAVADVAAGTDDAKAVTPVSLVGPVWAAGDVKYSARAAAADGWYIADGSLKDRVTDAPLFAAIGVTYGAGDGATTFALPDLRGEFIRGLDLGRGVDAGRALGSAQADLIKDHTHVLNPALIEAGNSWDHGSGGAFFANNASGSNATDGVVAGGGAETRPRNIALTPLIKR
jgi:microcystin-dependent protein